MLLSSGEGRGTALTGSTSVSHSMASSSCKYCRWNMIHTWNGYPFHHYFNNQATRHKNKNKRHYSMSVWRLVLPNLHWLRLMGVPGGTGGRVSSRGCRELETSSFPMLSARPGNSDILICVASSAAACSLHVKVSSSMLVSHNDITTLSIN